MSKKPPVWHVTLRPDDPQACMMIESWYGDRKVTLYIEEEDDEYGMLPTFIRVWGPNIYTQMDDGILNQDDMTLGFLVRWLQGE